MANQQPTNAAAKAATEAEEKLNALARREAASSQSLPPDVLERLERADAEIKRLNEALKAKEAEADATGGLKINPGDRPYTGDTGGWKFRVGPTAKAKYTDLPTVEINACDESEAKRWYCASHDYPKGSRRAIDPVAIDITVTCIDEGRNRLVQRKAKFANIRQKLFAGQTLTPDEDKILQDNYDEIQGVAK